ncbi:pyridoxamine 5'-phosphate oxidase family protein (plasmid) [Embleya sp. NBC_00888]|uniref:pyridoxamine 5'-phosphate oxidase family protein n=1 Tax=Embleya sp. NBC_00888 TaxID=2975960 RepID=UPI002F911A71|nr:pyridoxamine 5'-phosphate oxidase family protein [Embleya sp. NBC_00888]
MEQTFPYPDNYPLSGALTERMTGRIHGDMVTHRRSTVHSILREGFVCHVAFDYNPGSGHGDPYPIAVPTLYGFDALQERVYLHGSPNARLYQTALGHGEDGVPVCLTVTLVDGLALESVAAHSHAYYRSVMAFGNAIAVTNGSELDELATMVNHVVPGRWDDTVQPQPTDLKGVGVLSLSLNEVSAKVVGMSASIRKDGVSYQETPEPPHWAGDLPIGQAYGHPVTRTPDIALPAYLDSYHRPAREGDS